MIDMETLVREAMTEQTGDLHLSPDAATRALHAAQSRRRGHKRLGLLAGSGAAFAVAGTGIAAATGVMPWWRTHELDSRPFLSSADPTSVAGSQVRFTAPGPESTTFEIVTKAMTVRGTGVDCTALAVKDTQGSSQHLTSACGTADMAVPRAASIDWQAPSGATYAVVTGPDPSSAATRVVLQDSQGGTEATGSVGAGYFLVYVSAEQLAPSSRLVFTDTSGRVLDEFPLDASP